MPNQRMLFEVLKLTHCYSDALWTGTFAVIQQTHNENHWRADHITATLTPTLKCSKCSASASRTVHISSPSAFFVASCCMPRASQWCSWSSAWCQWSRQASCRARRSRPPEVHLQKALEIHWPTHCTIHLIHLHTCSIHIFQNNLRIGGVKYVFDLSKLLFRPRCLMNINIGGCTCHRVARIGVGNSTHRLHWIGADRHASAHLDLE